MSSLKVPADELAIFALSRFYSRHTMIYTSVRPWTTLAPDNSISIEEAHNRCQTHVVYLGQNMYGVLRPRSFVNIDAPLTIDEVLNPMRVCQRNTPEQQEPLNLSVLPRDNIDSVVSDPTVCSIAASNTETSIESPETVSLSTPDDPEVQEVGAETDVNLSETEQGNQEVITKPPTLIPRAGTSLALCRAVEDAHNKHFRVDLVLLTNAELEKYLAMKPDNNTKMDNIDNVTSVNEFSPRRSASNLTSRHAPVNYAESSISDGGSIHGDTTDSDQELEPEKPKRKNAVSRHGLGWPHKE